MWSSPLLVLLLFTVVVRSTISAPPPSTGPNRTLPYPHPIRAPRLTPTLMQELLGPDGGNRTLKAWNGQYLTERDRTLRTTVWSRADGQYWYIEQINDNKVALKSYTGKYIYHSDYGFAESLDVANGWEILTPVKNDDDTWSFKSKWDRWLSARRPDWRILFRAKNEVYEHWRLENWY